MNRYTFVCAPLPGIVLHGKITRLDRLYGHEFSVRAHYVARWAGNFLGLRDGYAVEIPVDSVKAVSSDALFEINLPDLLADPLVSGAANAGDFRLVVRDVTTGRELGVLEPADQNLRVKGRGLVIRPEYPETIVFTPCALTGIQPHDSLGFAIRPDRSDACGQ